MEKRKLSLSEARVQAGYLQAYVANRMGVSIVTLWNWERGKTMPDVDKAQQLARLYGVATDDILFTQIA